MLLVMRGTRKKSFLPAVVRGRMNRSLGRFRVARRLRLFQYVRLDEETLCVSVALFLVLKRMPRPFLRRSLIVMMVVVVVEVMVMVIAEW